MLYSEHEHNPDPRNGWFAFGLMMLMGILGLLWLQEKVRPRELLAPHAEELKQMQEEADTVS